MILYVSASTNCPDMMIDYIEVQLSNGELVSLYSPSYEELEVE